MTAKGAQSSRPQPGIEPAPRAQPEATLRACVRAALPERANVLLAVSGGSDSVALLAAAAAAPELAARAAVVHVQHGLRPAAQADAEHVRRLADALGLACRVVDAGPTASDPGRSETAARRRRLQALARAARETGAGWLLLAHHRDDEVETVLLRLLRGHRGHRALAGVPTARRLDDGVRLLRPFLWGRQRPGRSELAALRERAGLAHVEDETNRDLRVPRNAVRAALQAAAPGGEQDLPSRVSRLCAAARAGLSRDVAAAAAALMAGLAAEGRGSRLDRQSLPPAPEDGERLAETLRLLGECLDRPRRIDARAAVLDELRRRLAQRGGRLLVPATPAPLELEVSAGAVHLPHDAPAHPDPVACVLAALGRGPLFL